MNYSQTTLDFTPPPSTGSKHIGPIGHDDDGDGCDCCAQRLLCSKCGARFLGRVFAYYYRYNTRDEDGYQVGMNATYEHLLGPCCLPENPERFDAVMADDYPVTAMEHGEVIRKGEFVVGPYGVMLGRIWIPKVFPTGPHPWEERIREELASRSRGRKAKETACRTACV